MVKSRSGDPTRSQNLVSAGLCPCLCLCPWTFLWRTCLLSRRLCHCRLSRQEEVVRVPRYLRLSEASVSREPRYHVEM